MKLVAGVLFFLIFAVGAQSQDTAAEQKIDTLVRLLDDPEVRAWMETRRPEVEPVDLPGGSIVAWETSTRNRIKAVFQSIPKISTEISAAANRAREDALTHGNAPIFAIFLALLAIGLVAEKLFARTRRRQRDLGERLLSIAVFSVAMAVIFFALEWPPLARIVLLVSLLALVAYRIISVVISATNLSRSVRHRLRLFAGLMIVAVAMASLGQPLAVAPEVTAAISLLFSVFLLLIAIEGIISTSTKSLRTRLAFSLVLFAVWALWCIGLKGLFWLAIYALVLPATLRLAGHVAAEAIPSDPHSTKRVLLVRGSRAIVVAIAVGWLAIVWRYDPNSLVHINPAVTAISYGLLKSVVVLLLADLAWDLARSWIDHQLAPPSEAATDPSKTARQARLRTLLPIFRNVLAVVFAVIAGLIVLAELGVEIGPLIAGAGIFGVALGFGSQTLVKDVISGVFYMLDDAFRVGEYIQAKNYKGTVEGFSLRSVRLRHHRGPVFTVPFGELGAVENMSRDWGVVKFRISVSYDADVEKARKLTKKIGAALMEDPEFHPLFIEPLKMKGVEEFGDYGIVLGFGMTLRPSGLQSMIRRRANLMLREAFKENGIEFATPSVQVGSDSNGEALAAAATAVRVQQAKAAMSEG